METYAVVDAFEDLQNHLGACILLLESVSLRAAKLMTSLSEIAGNFGLETLGEVEPESDCEDCYIVFQRGKKMNDVL